MAERVDESLARRRFSMLLLTLFAALALGLATIGIYGVIAYLVTQGTRELGIRMALGARRAESCCSSSATAWASRSSAWRIGLAGASALTRFMGSLLFGVTASDPLTFIAVALLLTAVALLASCIPGRRAARIDPMISLRNDD